MSPFFRGDILLNFSDSVCFEGLETLTSTIDPIENNGTISEGIKIAGWRCFMSCERKVHVEVKQPS